MTYIAVILGATSLICGLIAAWFWYQASKIQFAPNFHELPEDVTESDFNWTLVKAIMTAVQQESALNRLAALWTAVAVVLGGVANFMGTLTVN
jgi:hypothetical protein